MKRPLTGLVGAYAAGIWIGSLTGWSAMILFAVAATLLAVFLFLQRTRFGLVTVLAAVGVAGAGAYRGAVTISSPNDITRLLEQRDQNVQMQGVIVSDTGYRAVPLNEDDAERQRFELELTAVEHYGQWRPAVGRILVFVSETRDAEPLRYGDRIMFSTILRVPPPMRNPGAFDWRTWLERKGIHFTAAGGPIGSMLALMSFFKTGVIQERALGVKLVTREDWLKILHPHWNPAKVDTAALSQLMKTRQQMVELAFNVDPAAAVLYFLTARCRLANVG